MDRNVRFYRVIQKSPYWGKMAFYFKNVPYVGTINLIAHTDASLSLIANSL